MDEAEARKRYVNEPVVPFSLSNPHPLFGKDPNIMNEFGHTHYPKWITVGEQQVLVNDAKHEKALLLQSTPKEPVKELVKEVKAKEKINLIPDKELGWDK